MGRDGQLTASYRDKHRSVCFPTWLPCHSRVRAAAKEAGSICSGCPHRCPAGRAGQLTTSCSCCRADGER